MKNILIMTIILFTGCSSIHITIEDMIDTSNIYSLNEYKKISSMKKGLTEVSIKEIDLILLKEKFVEGNEFEKLDPIYLKRVKKYIVEVLNDDNFRKEYNLQDLEELVYYKNKMLMVFCHTDKWGSGCRKDLVSMENNKLKRKSLDMNVGCIIVIPEDEELIN